MFCDHSQFVRATKQAGQDVFLEYRRTPKRYDQALPYTFSDKCLPSVFNLFAECLQCVLNLFAKCLQCVLNLFAKCLQCVPNLFAKCLQPASSGLIA